MSATALDIYIRDLSRGNDALASAAKLAALITGHQAAHKRAALTEQRARGAISVEEYETRMDAVDTVVEAMQRGVRTHAFKPTPEGAW